MTLAEKVLWFKRDCGHEGVVMDDEEYLLSIISSTFRQINEMGETDDGYEQMVYDDLVELHNRAVELFNALQEGGIA